MSVPGNYNLYREAFIRNCHVLIAKGYSEMIRSDFKRSQEPEVTGQLVRSIKVILQKADAPAWMDFFFIADDPPVHSAVRAGKSRRRVDIEIEKSERGVRPRLQFEAKRLHSSSSVGEYLGRDGLELFISGEYGGDQSDGGMLGYVQNETCARWAARIALRLNRDLGRFRVATEGEFESISIVSELESTHRSVHLRSGLAPITIYHTFLDFVN